MICVIATIEVVPGRRQEFLVEFHRIVPLVQAEEGCREYGPMVDVPTSIAAQPPARENTVVILEKWESIEALERHLVMPHMVEYRKRVKDLVLAVSLQVLEPV